MRKTHVQTAACRQEHNHQHKQGKYRVGWEATLTGQESRPPQDAVSRRVTRMDSEEGGYSERGNVLGVKRAGSLFPCLQTDTKLWGYPSSIMLRERNPSQCDRKTDHNGGLETLLPQPLAGT